MTELAALAQLGVRHILDASALDQVPFPAAASPVPTPRAIRRLAAACLALAVLAAAPAGASAHPLHTSLAELTYDRAARTLHVSLRVFADDLSTGLTSRIHTPAGASGLPPDTAIVRYLGTRFTMVDARGEAVALRGCGVRRVGAQLLVCLRADRVAPLDGARLRNVVLTDVFADQVNVVRIVEGARRRTLLFTPGDGAKTL